MKVRTRREYIRLCEKRRQLKRLVKKRKRRGITYVVPSEGTGQSGKAFKTTWGEKEE